MRAVGHDRPTVHDDPGALRADAAERFLSAAVSAVADRGRFDALLTGGSTLPPVYELLAAEPRRSRIEWSRVHLWWTDERCVPPDDPRSNYGSIRGSFLDRVPIPAAQVHRMRGEDVDPRREALRYEDELRRAGGAGEPRGFDFAFLGLGADAHVASLFPGAPALAIDDRLVAAVTGADTEIPNPPVDRITLTFPALARARACVFVATGSSKAEAVRAVLEDPADVTLRPAQGLDPIGGPPDWILDRGAAAALSGPR